MNASQPYGVGRLDPGCAAPAVADSYSIDREGTVLCGAGQPKPTAGAELASAAARPGRGVLRRLWEHIDVTRPDSQRRVVPTRGWRRVKVLTWSPSAAERLDVAVVTIDVDPAWDPILRAAPAPAARRRRAA